MNNVPKAVESSLKILEAAHRAGNLSSFKCEMKRMIKLLNKATKRQSKTDNSPNLFWDAMQYLDEKDKQEKDNRYAGLFNELSTKHKQE